jgi:hypothetical protein
VSRSTIPMMHSELALLASLIFEASYTEFVGALTLGWEFYKHKKKNRWSGYPAVFVWVSGDGTHTFAASSH